MDASVIAEDARTLPAHSPIEPFSLWPSSANSQDSSDRRSRLDTPGETGLSVMIQGMAVNPVQQETRA